MWYVTLRAVCRVLLRFFFQYRVEGRENVPETGPLVLCSNHISLIDPPLLGSAMDRHVYFVAKEELFKIPVFGALLRQLGAFPVKRGAADRAFLRRALGILQKGEVLGIFPEGTRSKTEELGTPHAGASLFAIKGNAAVVPVAIIGPYRLFHPIRIRFGKPMDLSKYQNMKLTSAVLDEVSQKIMQEISFLMKNRTR